MKANGTGAAFTVILVISDLTLYLVCRNIEDILSARGEIVRHTADGDLLEVHGADTVETSDSTV